MVLQNYQNFIEMTSDMIYIVAVGGGLTCSPKVHLNTVEGGRSAPGSDSPARYRFGMYAIVQIRPVGL